jgi:hypothetical protein
MARASKLKTGPGGRKVSAKSKTGDPACSQAMSSWKRTGMTPAIAAILGRCRSKARMLKQGASARNAGNETRAQAMESRAARGLTQGERAARAKELRARRAAPRAEPPGPTTKDRTRAMIRDVRSLRRDRGDRPRGDSIGTQARYNAMVARASIEKYRAGERGAARRTPDMDATTARLERAAARYEAVADRRGGLKESTLRVQREGTSRSSEASWRVQATQRKIDALRSAASDARKRGKPGTSRTFAAAERAQVRLDALRLQKEGPRALQNWTKGGRARVAKAEALIEARASRPAPVARAAGRGTEERRAR